MVLRMLDSRALLSAILLWVAFLIGSVGKMAGRLIGWLAGWLNGVHHLVRVGLVDGMQGHPSSQAATAHPIGCTPELIYAAVRPNTRKRNTHGAQSTGQSTPCGDRVYRNIVPPSPLLLLHLFIFSHVHHDHADNHHRRRTSGAVVPPPPTTAFFISSPSRAAPGLFFSCYLPAGGGVGSSSRDDGITPRHAKGAWHLHPRDQRGRLGASQRGKPSMPHLYLRSVLFLSTIVFVLLCLFSFFLCFGGAPLFFHAPCLVLPFFYVFLGK